MAESTGIEWTDSTWNPIAATKGKWHCVKVSEACRNCYAEAFNKRLGGPDYKVGADTVRLNPNTLADPIRYEGHVKRGAKLPGHFVFPCSMTDLHGEFVPFLMRAVVYAIMSLCPSLRFQVLTKRPGSRMAWRRELLARARARGMDPVTFLREILRHEVPGLGPKVAEANAKHVGKAHPWPLSNVWEGCTVEHADTVERIEEIPNAAPVRIISAEPLLGPLELPDFVRGERWWVIAGGESGKNARPMRPEWVRQLRDDCAARGVPFFFKQWGRWAYNGQHQPRRGFTHVVRGNGRAFTLQEARETPDDGLELFAAPVGKRFTGAELDGQTWKQIPAVFPDGEGLPY